VSPLRLWLVFLAGLGLFNTGYLTYEKLTSPTGEVVCPLNGGCNVVLASPYAQVGNIPLAVFGLGLYTLLLMVALWPFGKEPLRWWLLWGLASSGVAFSGYLMSLLLWEIKAFCPYCLGSACTLATLWLTLLISQKELRLPRGLGLSLACMVLMVVASLSLYTIQKNTPPPIPKNFGILN